MNVDRPIKIEKGKGLALYCNTERNRYRMLKWYKREAGTDKKLRYAGGDLVIIPNVTKSDSGTYVCKMHSPISGKTLREETVEVVVLGEFND